LSLSLQLMLFAFVFVLGVGFAAGFPLSHPADQVKRQLLLGNDFLHLHNFCWLFGEPQIV